MANIPREQYNAAIADCKDNRKSGMCEHECQHWHPDKRGFDLFCKSVMRQPRMT